MRPELREANERATAMLTSAVSSLANPSDEEAMTQSINDVISLVPLDDARMLVLTLAASITQAANLVGIVAELEGRTPEEVARDFALARAITLNGLND